MDETKITQQLQQNIPKPDAPTIAVDTPGDTGYTADVGDALGMYKLYDYFDVQPSFRTGDSEQKIQTIYRWAANIARSTDYLQVASVIAEHEQMMGSYHHGNALDRMYSYIKLEQQISRLKQEQGWL